MVNNVQLFKGDCLEIMKGIDDKSIDMILCDLPYGTTRCKWDIVIPFDALWEQYNRIIKDNGAIVLFGSEPFSSMLRMSNIKEYKYDWKWDKVRGVGHLNAKKRPMMCTEDIMVFYKKQCVYNPQMRDREKARTSKNNNTQEVYGKSKDNFVGSTLDKKYPINLITFNKSSHEDMLLHPTQKPIALLEYLIKTYTKEDEIVLDNCMGSGSTGVACVNVNRKFIGIEKDDNYFEVAKRRMQIVQEKYKVFEQLGTTREKQLKLFAISEKIDINKLIRDKEIEDLLIKKIELECEITMMKSDIDEIEDAPLKEKELDEVNKKLDKKIEKLRR